MPMPLMLKAGFTLVVAGGVLWASLGAFQILALAPHEVAKELGVLDSGIPLPAGEVCSLALSPDGTLAAVGTRGGLVRIWETATRRPYARWQAHEGFVGALAFCPVSRALVTTGADRTVRFWSLDATETPRWCRPCPEPTLVTALAVSPDGRTVALASDDRLGFCDARQGLPIPRRELIAAGTRLRALAFAPDGATLAGAGGGDNTIRVWALGNGVPVQQLKLAGDSEHWVRGLAYMAEGSTLVSFDTGGLVRAWSRTGNQTGTIHAGPAPFMQVALGAGRIILTADGGEGPARVLCLPENW